MSHSQFFSYCSTNGEKELVLENSKKINKKLERKEISFSSELGGKKNGRLQTLMRTEWNRHLDTDSPENLQKFLLSVWDILNIFVTPSMQSTLKEFLEFSKFWLSIWDICTVLWVRMRNFFLGPNQKLFVSDLTPSKTEERKPLDN